MSSIHDTILNLGSQSDGLFGSEVTLINHSGEEFKVSGQMTDDPIDIERSVISNPVFSTMSANLPEGIEEGNWVLKVIWPLGTENISVFAIQHPLRYHHGHARTVVPLSIVEEIEE